MEVMTSGCRAQGHPEVVIELGAATPADGKWLVGHLEQAVAGGERFAAGETLQVGWMQVRFEPAAPGYLSLSEPDLRSMPIRWVPGAGRALTHLRRHADVAKQAGLFDELDVPSILERAIVCTKFRDARAWVLSRAAPTPGDSGWFLGCTSAAHDHRDPQTLAPISLYEAAIHVPDAIPYLALPADSEVVFGRGVPTEGRRRGVPLPLR